MTFTGAIRGDMRPEARMTNVGLHQARADRNDEFYTQLEDVERELGHYYKHFSGKTVLCNCDDPEESNFWKYFALNFSHLNLNKLVSTHFGRGTRAYKLEITKYNSSPVKKYLDEDGDFRSAECIELLREADIIATNPPFSLFREYIALLMAMGKQFIVVGNKNAITYSDMFQWIREDRLWTGYRGFSGGMWFYVPPESESYDKIIDGRKLKNVPTIWYTNLDIKKRQEVLSSYRGYDDNYYPEYDNYNAIDVSKTVDIPEAYHGAMGVPITFLDKYNPEQFEILNSNNYRKWDHVPYKEHGLVKDKDGTIDGKAKYVRILIRRRVP